MSLLPVKPPEIGKPVKVVLKHSLKWYFVTDVILVAVNEDDCSWRTFDDNSELSHMFDVIYWEYFN